MRAFPGVGPASRRRQRGVGWLVLIMALSLNLLPLAPAQAQTVPQVARLSNGAQLGVEERPSSTTLAVLAPLRYGVPAETPAEKALPALLPPFPTTTPSPHPPPPP